ncbi:MAG: GNAT family N-acetyltransferase [Oscillospiraceae bacterium]|nr:GNAT family N-acetyltransferase [Oscillospiraceae bacterium]
MNIRKLTIADYDKVYALWLSCKGMGLNNLDDSRNGIERFLKRNPETCFVAENSGEVIGVIIAGNDGRRGYIYHIAVNSEYRRKGIAKALVNSALKALRDLGINKTALVVFERNADGNAFWESIGFTSRDDLVYRNKALTEIIRIDT